MDIIKKNKMDIYSLYTLFTHLNPLLGEVNKMHKIYGGIIKMVDMHYNPTHTNVGIKIMKWSSMFVFFYKLYNTDPSLP